MEEGRKGRSFSQESDGGIAQRKHPQQQQSMPACGDAQCKSCSCLSAGSQPTRCTTQEVNNTTHTKDEKNKTNYLVMSACPVPTYFICKCSPCACSVSLPDPVVIVRMFPREREEKKKHNASNFQKDTFFCVCLFFPLITSRIANLFLIDGILFPSRIRHRRHSLHFDKR